MDTTDRLAERRDKLERDTAAYFANLPARVAIEEAELEAALSHPDDEIRAFLQLPESGAFCLVGRRSRG